MRINLIIVIALTLSLIGCQRKQLNKSTLNGSWLFDDESAQLELNSTDNHYTLEIPHATLSMKGNWEVSSIKIGNRKTDFLILSNETPKEIIILVKTNLTLNTTFLLLIALAKNKYLPPIFPVKIPCAEISNTYLRKRLKIDYAVAGVFFHRLLFI